MAVPTKSWKPLEVLRFAARKERVKKLHFIAWERAREKGALRCTGKNERKRVALRCSGQSGKESRTGEERAAPGGCECHRNIGSARWLRMLRPVAANATDRLHKKLEICCCDNIFFVDMCPKTSTEPVG